MKVKPIEIKVAGYQLDLTPREAMVLKTFFSALTDETMDYVEKNATSTIDNIEEINDLVFDIEDQLGSLMEELQQN